MKYSKLKWSMRGAFFIGTLLTKSLLADALPIVFHLKKSVRANLLNHYFLKACITNAEQLATNNNCLLNVTLGSSLLLTYAQNTEQDPLEVRERRVKAVDMFNELSMEDQQQLFDSLDMQSHSIIVATTRNENNSIYEMELVSYLTTAYYVAQQQQMRGALLDNFACFLEAIKQYCAHMPEYSEDDIVPTLLKLNRRTKEYLYNLLDNQSLHLIERYIKQRCATAAKLVNYHNSLPL